MYRLVDNVLDTIWPCLIGDPESEPTDDDVCLENFDDALIVEFEDLLKDRSKQTDDRFRTTDSKLLALLSLTSVLSAVLTAGITFALRQDLSEIPSLPFYAVAALLIYIALQLLVALFSTVSGLTRIKYYSLRKTDIDPQAGESVISYRIRIVKIIRNQIWWNEWSINRKVERMAVAHVAVRNTFLGASGLLIIIALASYLKRTTG